MKVLQTLGRHGGHQEGIFQYKRSSSSVQIDLSVGQTQVNPQQIELTAAEWASILSQIEQAPQNSFRLTPPTGAIHGPPNQVLYTILTQAVPNPAGGWNWHDSYKAAVCAILEHEGSIDLYHGALGPQHSAYIALSRDI